MSEVVRRTVFAERVDGAYRFFDWAVVTFKNSISGLSRMVEPFMVNQRYNMGVGLREFDPTDPAVRVDYIQLIKNEGDLVKILSGGGDTALHGGVMTPTIGKDDMRSRAN